METSMTAVTAWELEAERRREIAGVETIRVDAGRARSIRSVASIAADREDRTRAWISSLLGRRSTGRPRVLTTPAGKPH